MFLRRVSQKSKVSTNCSLQSAALLKLKTTEEMILIHRSHKQADLTGETDKEMTSSISQMLLKTQPQLGKEKTTIIRLLKTTETLFFGTSDFINDNLLHN